MLDQEFIPKLKELTGNDTDYFKRFIFQQDGAKAHTSNESMWYLATQFGNNIISDTSPFMSWPPHRLVFHHELNSGGEIIYFLLN